MAAALVGLAAEARAAAVEAQVAVAMEKVALPVWCAEENLEEDAMGEQTASAMGMAGMGKVMAMVALTVAA